MEAAISRAWQRVEDEILSSDAVAHRSSRRGIRPLASIALASVALLSIAGVAAAIAPSGSALHNATAGLLDVFSSEKQSASEKPTDTTATRLHELDDVVKSGPLSSDIGDQVGRDTRVLLRDGFRGHRLELTAVRTSNNQLCYTAVLTTPTSGGVPVGSDTCIRAFDPAWPISGSGHAGARVATVAYGVASDDVAKVQFRVNGTTENARMGTNSYFWAGAEAGVMPDEIVVTLKDGSELRRSGRAAGLL